MSENRMLQTTGYRMRRFSTKARTGCITCKIRRIKCDEAKPSCHRCISTGRKCDGYVAGMSNALKLIQRPGLPSSGNNAEKQALYMFRTKIAMLIASAFDVEFWTYDLLQTAEAYQTVHHAVAALAAAYHVSILSDQGGQMGRQFVLAQYSKSISSLNQCFNKAKFCSREKQVVVLITNVLFICICALQGSRAEACLHLRSGLSLLHEWKLGVAEEMNDSDITPTSVKLLVTVYTQLDTQARIIIKTIERCEGKPWTPHNVALDGWGSGYIETVTKAFSQLERLHNRALQNAALLQSVESNSHYHSNLLEDYRRQLSIWDSNFGWLLRNTDSYCSSIKALHMRRLLVGANLEVNFGTAGNTSEHDETWFEEILDLAYQITQDPAFQERGIAFSPTGGLVEALYFVATGSQEDSIQRKAVDLLGNYPTIEGLWNSFTALEALAQRNAPSTTHEAYSCSLK